MIERYQDAFEVGDLNPANFNECLTTPRARLDALHDRDQVLAADLSAEVPTSPDNAELRAVADRLDQVIANGEPSKPRHCSPAS